MIGYLFFLLLFASLNAHEGCIHDQIIHKQKLIAIDDTVIRGRRLQDSEYGPIRFHIIYNTTDVDSSTTMGQNIIKLMDILQMFWKKTIQVYYAPSLSFNVATGIDSSYVQCLSFIVPQSVIRTPVPNADYGILVQAKNDGDSGVTAYSYPCAYSLTTKQPLWGLLHWNSNYFTYDLLSFQMNIKIGIHESTHLLGFSSILYSNYVEGKHITNSEGSFINGSYIQKALLDQYGCVGSSGMPLQSGGGQGTALSHWSYKTAYNQFMTAGVLISNPTISYITLALLEETGWYKSISKAYGQYINWGFQKGCSMLSNKNCSSAEYCTQERTLSCDYDQTSLGSCKNQSITNCLFVKYYANYLCSDPNFAKSSFNSALIGQTGEEGGQHSRCFVSNLVTQGSNQTKYAFRCYSAICSPSGRTLTIKVGSRYTLCMFPGQNVTVSGYTGYLLCPKSFTRTCAVKLCPSSCNANGVCLNGKCLCSSGYSGEACDQVSSVGFASRLPYQIFFASKNNNCLFGSYLDEFGQCKQCSPKCGFCDQNGCQICMDQSLPDVDGKCH